MEKKKLIVIVGPTGVGKTGLAIRLAKHFGTEIISADSRQIYKGLNIGTAKPSAADLGEVPHHLISFKEINEEYDAGQFGRDALGTIHRLLEHQHEVILCGGSGLYVKAVCEGFDAMPEVPAEIRKEIMAGFEEHGLPWLQERVKALDPDYFGTVDQKNPHRLVRALELNYASGKQIGELRQNQKLQHPFSIVKIGLELERSELFRRIESRMDEMISHGLFEEAKGFYSMKNLNALQTVGYQEIFGFFDGYYNREEAVRLLKRNSRRYAKRQMTWFKKDDTISWFGPDQVEDIIRFVAGFEIQASHKATKDV